MANKAPEANEKPSFRTTSLSAAIKKSWGTEWSRPDIAYEMSNGRKFDSTDRRESGVYKQT
jgi:hypothetical protein